MEPEEALDINNEIRDLEYMEKREIIRILTRLTDQLRPNIPALRKATNFLGVLDFVRAKARFALKTESHKPILTQERTLQWSHSTTSNSRDFTQSSRETSCPAQH